ncbi:hypothetical protein Tco_1236925 [Tanacetum coccineum]
MYGFKECSSCGALYNREHCCSNVSSVDNFVRDPNPISYDETPDSSQQPPRNCSKCGGRFGGLYCRQCTCERCRRNYTDEVCALCCYEVEKSFFPVIRQSPQATSTEALQARESLMKYIQTFLKKFNRISFRETPKVLLLAWEIFFEIKHACKEKQHQSEDIQELLCILLKDVQIIDEELADYINILNWNCPAFYHDDDEYDDEEYTIAIKPVLPTEEPDNSLSMGDEHLSSIPDTESVKVIKSSVEDLVPIPSESKGISDYTCDVPFCGNSPPLDVLNDHFNIFYDFNDDCTSSDDDSFENIDYVEASPPDSELVSLEEIESLNDNPTPDCVLKSPSTFPIPVKDNDSFFKKSDTSLSYSDNSLPEFETFSDHTEKTSTRSTTTHADNSLPEYDSFLFETEPDQGELTSVVMEDILGELPRSFVDNFVRDPNPISYDETPDSSQQPPRNCSKCGGRFGGLYCRQCTCERCRRNYMDEVCALCCYEVEKSFVNDSNPNSFIDSPNFFNQPPHYSSSQPQTYSCELCGNDAHYGYDCPPQVPFISNPDPCYNQDLDNFLQTSLNFQQQYLCCENCGGPHETFQCQPLNQNFYEPNHCYNSNSFGFDQSQPPQFPVIRQSPQATSTEALQARENLMKSIQTFLKKFNRISFRETPKVLLLAWENFFEIKHACKEKQHQPEDIQELLRKLLKDVQIISEELADYINIPNWNCPAFYHDDDEDDDEEYTIAITPVLPTEEPDNSLSMGDEHLSTIPETESDEVIKSSVEDLVPIPSESEGISDDTCDVPFCDNSPPLDVLNDHFEIFSDFNDDCTSSDDDSFENIDYVEASPPDSELVSLEEVKDDILREKLLNIYLLIAKIESLNDNPTPDCVLKSPSTFPIPVEDSDSFFKKSDTSLSYSDNSLPEFETFSDHTEKTSSGSTTTHADNSLPEYDSFLFETEPDQGELTSVVMEDILGEPRVPNVLPTHPTLYLDSDFAPSDDSLKPDLVVSFPSGTRNKIFDPGIFIEVQSKRFLSPHEFSISFIRDPLSTVFDTLLPFSSENEEKVFNPGSLSSNEEKSPHLLSHRGFNPSKIISDFSESPMMISRGDIPILDVFRFSISILLDQLKIAPDYEASRAHGFVLRSLELQSLA